MVGIDFLLVLLVFIFSYLVRILLIDSQGFLTLSSRISIIVLPGIFIHLICFYIFGLYDRKTLTNSRLTFILVVFAVFSSSAGVSLLSYMFPEDKRLVV
ncbi:hypothetical protein C6A37_04015 [Desulfobacteraceae bacterium SEEP-SAG9]|nr:hypothetical protein C6A37_04015 [Desulfobacteraceae bacterium SEEP-SAG9]